MCRNPLLWPYISQPVGFSLPPFVLSREVFADVYKGGMSVIKKCHGCFLGLREIYTNPAHFLYFGATRLPQALACHRRARLVERSALSILAK